MLILLSAVLTSCIKQSHFTGLDVILKPGIGVRKDIGIAD